MRNRIWVVVCLFALLGSAIGFAQFRPVLKADIPFDFNGLRGI